MIFVTVGSRSFPFDRLLEAVDQAVLRGEIQEKVFAQTGSGTYQPKAFESAAFLDHDQFDRKLEEASLVITHGGTGVIMNAVKRGRRVVAVPRLKCCKEVVDDHQLQLIRELEQMGLITACYDCGQIGEAVRRAMDMQMIPYQSNAAAIISSIEAYLETI